MSQAEGKITDKPGERIDEHQILQCFFHKFWMILCGAVAQESQQVAPSEGVGPEFRGNYGPTQYLFPASHWLSDIELPFIEFAEYCQANQGHFDHRIRWPFLTLRGL